MSALTIACPTCGRAAGSVCLVTWERWVCVSAPCLARVEAWMSAQIVAYIRAAARYVAVELPPRDVLEELADDIERGEWR